jgi:hypothetical protein
MLQGLALGGEYGGAATYVAEHAPSANAVSTPAGFSPPPPSACCCRCWWCWLPLLHRRSVRSLGLAHSVPAVDRAAGHLHLDPHEPARVAGLRENEEEGKASKSPIRESFGKWENLKVVLIALFSINAGQAVTFYAAQFYVLFFLTQFLKMDPALANMLLIISVVIGAPFFIFFGWLSDKVGRKPVLMLGLLLATALYFPIFKAGPLRQPGNRPGQPPGADHRAGRPSHLHLPVRPGGQGAV